MKTANELRKEFVPAFPMVCDDLSKNQVIHVGLEARDYFAARFASAEIQRIGMDGCDKFLICAMAYEIADAMMEARQLDTK